MIYTTKVIYTTTVDGGARFASKNGGATLSLPCRIIRKMQKKKKGVLCGAHKSVYNHLGSVFRWFDAKVVC